MRTELRALLLMPTCATAILTAQHPWQQYSDLTAIGFDAKALQAAHATAES